MFPVYFFLVSDDMHALRVAAASASGMLGPREALLVVTWAAAAGVSSDLLAVMLPVFSTLIRLHITQNFSQLQRRLSVSGQ